MNQNVREFYRKSAFENISDNAKWTTKKEACDIQTSVIIIGYEFENESNGLV